jgi:ankyrin repeat protein
MRKKAYCALSAAVRNDHVSVVGAFVARRPHLLTTTPPDFLTTTPPDLLSLAACHGSVHVIAVLLAAKASVDGADSCYYPPLCVAAREGQLSSVSLLLAMKACTGRGRFGFNALHVAVEFGHADVAERLLRANTDHRQPNGNGETPVYLAATRKSGEPALRVLLDAHADVNPPSPYPSPLCGAARYARPLSVFRLLLGARADVSIVTTPGCTALSLAVVNMCPDTVVKLLLCAKTNVNTAPGDGFTALHYAVMHGRCSIARLLVRAKADVRAETVAGNTAATLARDHQHFELAAYFEAIAGL